MITVIGVLAVLAVLGVSLVVIATTQHFGAALDLQGVRAYHAARSGLDWALFQVLRDGRSCADIGGRTLSFGDNLTGFHARIQCNSSTHAEAGASITMFDIQSTACNETTCPWGPAPPAAYVERQVRATVGRP